MNKVEFLPQVGESPRQDPSPTRTLWQKSHFVRSAPSAVNEQNAIPDTGGGESRRGRSPGSNPVGATDKTRFLTQVGESPGEGGAPAPILWAQ